MPDGSAGAVVAERRCGAARVLTNLFLWFGRPMPIFLLPDAHGGGGVRVFNRIHSSRGGPVFLLGAGVSVARSGSNAVLVAGRVCAS